MQAIVNGFVELSNVAVANITAAEGLASYENIHPFYIQVRKGLSFTVADAVSTLPKVILVSGLRPAHAEAPDALLS